MTNDERKAMLFEAADKGRKLYDDERSELAALLRSGTVTADESARIRIAFPLDYEYVTSVSSAVPPPVSPTAKGCAWIAVLAVIGVLVLFIYRVTQAVSGGVAEGSAQAQHARQKSPRLASHHHRSTDAELAKMRTQWVGTEEAVMTPGSSIRGQINGLLGAFDPTSIDRHYYLILDAPPDNVAQDLPAGWGNARDALNQSAAVVKTAQDALRSWEDGSRDLDDDFKTELLTDVRSIDENMCSALDSARSAYKATGGYPNDLFVLDSGDGGKQDPCPDVLMARPYITTVVGRQLITKSWSDNETDSPDNWSAFVDDNNGFIVASGTSVSVIANRYSDSVEITLCKIHGGGGTGWVACRHLEKQPNRAVND